MTVRAVSKYRDSSSRTSSASRDSDKGVKPTRSANRTEQTRRSASGANAGWPAPDAGAVTVASTDPHSPQNFCAAPTGALQEGHVSARAVPHSWQNFPVAGLGAAHAGHDTAMRA